jgi:hypothetical protein
MIKAKKSYFQLVRYTAWQGAIPFFNCQHNKKLFCVAPVWKISSNEHLTVDYDNDTGGFLSAAGMWWI